MNCLYKLLNKHERPATWLAKKLHCSPARMTKISKMTDKELADYLTIIEAHTIDIYLPSFLQTLKDNANLKGE